MKNLNKTALVFAAISAFSVLLPWTYEYPADGRMGISLWIGILGLILALTGGALVFKGIKWAFIPGLANLGIALGYMISMLSERGGSGLSFQDITAGVALKYGLYLFLFSSLLFALASLKGLKQGGATRNFFDLIEETAVFPLGRKTWQTLALFSLTMLSISILYFVYNMVPASRGSVQVTKEEVFGLKKQESAEQAPKEDNAECTQKDFLALYDSLEQKLPGLEWVNLGDSVDSYDWVYDYYEYRYVQVYKKRFNANPNAVPNMLNRIYLSRSVRSLCDSIDVLKTLHILLLETAVQYREQAFTAYFECMVNTALNAKSAEIAVKVKRDVLQNNVFVGGQEDLNVFTDLISAIVEYSPSYTKLQEAANLLQAHRELKSPVYQKSGYWELVKVVFAARLDSTDLTEAMEGITDDLQFYDSKTSVTDSKKDNLPAVLRKYIKMYSSRLETARDEQVHKNLAKAEKRAVAFTYGAFAFAAIVGIAMILLLFSIQSMLRKHIKEE